jgi:hypothetical protein
MADRYIVSPPKPAELASVLRETVDRFVAEASRRAVEAVVVVPQLRQLKQAAPAFGVDAADLEANREIVAPPLNLRFYIRSSLPRFEDWSGKPVLALWVDDQLLDDVEAMTPSMLCVVPWLAADVERWVANHSPVDLETGEPLAGAEAITDPVVLDVLRPIASRGGVLHPRDKETAVEALKTLNGQQRLPSAESLDAWAVAAGLSNDDARRLRDWASALHNGKRIRAR